MQIFNESSTFRSVIKVLARGFVQVHYKSILDPPITDDISGNQEHIKLIVRDGIKGILDDCSFHAGGRDENVCLIFLYILF